MSFLIFRCGGSYRIDGQSVHMTSAAGESLAKMYILEKGDRQYLLSVGQFESLGQTGTYDECAMVRGGYQDNS